MRKLLTLASTGALALALLVSCRNDQNAAEGDASNFNDFRFLEATIAELQTQLTDGTLTSEELTKAYLDRIESIDQNGPQLNSVIEVNPDALAIARSLDEERAQGQVRGPMHGIPVLIKDNIDTGDEMMTTAGALALKGNYASEDAFLVQKLRASGAILLGKTNLSEWANFRSTRSSSGWSSRGGQTRNPYILDRNPCGSSSGSGASVSANLCMAAIGTETNGSIVCPSTINGIVGIKPTVGLVSRSGVIPIAFSQDIAGPMARTVSDAAIFLGALTGVDSTDSESIKSTDKALTDYTPYLDENGLDGKRLGIWRSRLGRHEEVDSIMIKAFQAMEAAGATLVDVDELIPNVNRLYRPARLILEYEFKDGVNRYLATHQTATGVQSLADVIRHNLDNAEKAMPYFKMEILESSQDRGDLSTQEYIDARDLVKSSAQAGIDNTLERLDLDAIIAPTGGPSWCIDLINGDNFGGGSSSPAAWAGYPNITVPAGYIEGLPVGISFFGKAWSEGELIRLAYSFEQKTKVRKAPEFRPTIEF